jgi:hypothetical protein
MSTGNANDLDMLYDPANKALLAFEKERARFYRDGLGAIWGGSTILDYTTTAQLLDLAVSGATATVRLYERTSVRWLARPQPIPAEGQAARQREPERYRPAPTGPQGETTTTLGVRHEVTLVKGAGGWRVAKDAFDETPIYLRSPDVVPGSWVEIRRGGPAPGSAAAPTAADATPDTMVAAMATYNPALAVQAAQNNCTAYNSAFCSWSHCYTDCANFVSQCFLAGGMPQGGGWSVNYQGCPCVGPYMPSVGYHGSPTWVNNQALRDWVNAPGAGRGYPVANQWQVGAGDIINYQIGSTGGTVDHVVIVTGMNANGPVVCSHTNDMCNGPWTYYTFNYATFSHVNAG